MPLSLERTSSEEVAYTYEDLSAYTKAELLIIAEDIGVQGVSSGNLKDEIINAILQNQVAE